MMDMDAQKFTSKLRQTFKILFIGRKTPHDDTLLEKFATLLETKLNDSTGESALIIESINAVPWMKTLFENWKTIDSSVAAFGFNVIGVVVSSHEACQNIVIKNHVDALRRCLQDLVQEFAGLPALLRFSTLKLLHKLTISKATNLLPVVPPDFPLNSLTDDSIFVARAAKEFSLCILVDFLGRMQSDNAESCEITKSVEYLLTCIKAADTDFKAKRKAIAAIQLLQEVCLSSQSAVPCLISSTRLKSTLIDVINKTDNEDVCSSCSHLLLLVIECQSNNNIPQEWLAVVDILIRNQQFTCVAKFATLTGERWANKNIEISHILKTILLRPLILVSHWRSSQQLPWMIESEDNWNKSLKFLSTNCKRPELSKLLNCVLANLPKLHECFKNSEERFALLDLLLFILANFDQYESYPIKMQNITVDSILGILTNWGSHWFSQLSVDCNDKLLTNSIIILDKYATPPSLMIKIMKIVQLLLKNVNFNLASDWKTVLTRMNNTVQNRCNDVQWEIRDSAFELLAEMAKLAKEQNYLQEWLKASGSLNIAVIALDDTEGYVRATSLHFFKSIPEIICEEQEIVDVDVVATIKPIEIILKILLQDSEGITRRAAITTLLICYKNDLIQNRPTYMNYLYKSMVIAAMDLDWEVKLTSVDFWDTVLTKVFASSMGEEAKLTFLSKTGFFDAAMSLAEDEDVTVQHKMAHLIKRLQELFCLSLATFTPSIAMSDNESSHKDFGGPHIAMTVSEEAHDVMEVAISEEQKLLTIETVLNTRDCVTVENAMVSAEKPHTSADWLRGDRIDLNELLAKHHHIRIPVELSQFVSWLHKLNVDSLLLQTDLTTDLYNANPESLLDDILLDNYESDNEEEIAMDCY